MIKLKARASTINATSTEKLREYANDDGTFDETTQAAIRAELARREQAQAPQHTPGPWGVGYGEDRVITIGPYPCVVADCAPNDELSLEEVAANAALIARAPELLAENEHLRAKLAEGPPQNVHQYKSALANMEQTINDLHRKNDINNALMTEAAQKIDELRAEVSRLESILDDLQAECVRRSDTNHSLRAENARLRSLLAECVDIIDVLMMDDGILSEPQYAAIETAKETING